MMKAMRRSSPAFVLALACLLLGAGAARAQDTPSDVVTRLDRLEETVRDLTGQVQELQYHNQQLEQQLQQLQSGAASGGNAVGRSGPPPPPVANVAPMAMDQRATVSTSLPPPSATQYSAPPPAQYSPPPAAQYGTPQYGAAAVPPVSAPATDGHDAFNPAINPGAPGTPRPLGATTTATEPPPVDPAMDSSNQPGAPLNLNLPGAQANAAPSGALPPPPMANPSATGAMPAGEQEASLPPNATPKDEFDLGYGYVAHKNYGLAEQTFRDFLHKFPGDRLTPEAQYWLGESLFQDRNYHDAAEAFLTVSTKYDTSGKAPEALLRLGQSLAALGEKEAACASLGEVLHKYPHASLSVKQNVDREQKRVHC
ncbi:MAG: tol-pal system protein YbgF [Xanthobacteraceae bacterium]